jgi:signal transduction histidine kinase
MTADTTTAPGTPVTPGLAPADQVRRTLFRILAALRVVVLAYAVWVNVERLDRMERPELAVAGLVGMAVWTLVANVFYELRRRPPGWFLVLDVVMACAFFGLTPLTRGEEMWSRGGPSLPTLWVFGAVLAVSVARGWPRALLAAFCVSAVDVLVRAHPTFNVVANIFLLWLAAAAVGAMSTALCRAAEVSAAAERMQAAAEERARLARAVHDGVLQVLAMVQRRAQEEPGLADLGRLAGEQEASLRALVQYDARVASGSLTGHSAETDLVHALEQVVDGRSLSGPGRPVVLPAQTVTELTAAVSECLLNIARHVGEDASAWVLVEELDDEVVVTVRDEGPGIADDRLHAAAAEGRMGVSGSIVGRLRDLGGRAELVTGPTIGTEWELHVPRTTAQEGRAP